MRKALLAAVAAIAAASLATPSRADDSRIRYRCKVEGSTDISMSAKWEARGSSRKKFSVEFEAAPGIGFSEGDKLDVKVDGTGVGQVKLFSIRGGDVVGDLNYDTKPTEEDADPFPGKFPKSIVRGTKVALTKGDGKLLACELR